MGALAGQAEAERSDAPSGSAATSIDVGDLAEADAPTLASEPFAAAATGAPTASSDDIGEVDVAAPDADATVASPGVVAAGPSSGETPDTGPPGDAAPDLDELPPPPAPAPVPRPRIEPSGVTILGPVRVADRAGEAVVDGDEEAGLAHDEPLRIVTVEDIEREQRLDQTGPAGELDPREGS
ncbi:MAG: hypothetical protein R2726_01510 [Acidimicrobiales bacterium]